MCGSERPCECHLRHVIACLENRIRIHWYLSKVTDSILALADLYKSTLTQGHVFVQDIHKYTHTDLVFNCSTLGSLMSFITGSELSSGIENEHHESVVMCFYPNVSNFLLVNLG